MSDKPDLYGPNGSGDGTKIGISISGQMFMGFIVAGGIFFGAWIFVVALAWLGSFLPPESKEAVDPTPDSFVSQAGASEAEATEY